MILRHLVAQGDSSKGTMTSAISEALKETLTDRLDVAVAYATQSGLNALRGAIGEWPDATRWVVGLDDAITQPSAIDDVMALPNSQVRLASLSKKGRRFHPKIYCFWHSQNPATCLTVIGSANMTLHGLERNGEVGVILKAEDEHEVVALKAAWSEMALLGRDVSLWDLDAYRLTYARARTARRRMAKIDAIPLNPDTDEQDEGVESAGEIEQAVEVHVDVFNGHPSSALTAWTEGASPSAGGRDLEFPRAIMPYFKLGPSPVTKRFRMANGQVFPLTFTMRKDNQMWRLLFSRDAINAGVGRESLRPISGGNRSDLTIVFRRSGGGADFDISLIQIGSTDHAALIARSKAFGALDRTRDPGGRYFGYY